MSITLSTSLRRAQGMKSSLQEIFEGGELSIFTGTPPTADSAYSGTLLVSCTNAAAARTAETQATAIITVTGGTVVGDTCTSITIDGYEILGATVTWETSHTVTAAKIATQINKYASPVIKIWATSAAAVVTISACPGQGAALNTLAIVCTHGGAMTTTINGASADQMGLGAGGSTAGVASVSGLTFAEISGGTLTLNCTISGTPVATGAAGYWRLEGCNTPTGTSVADATATPRYRLQGTCGLSGADMIFSGTTTITSGVTHTVTSGSFTVPAS